MPDLLDFVPIRRESRHTIRARLDAAVNAGLVPSSPMWIDTQEGGFYWDTTQPAVLELERLWDMVSLEYVAVIFLPYSYGIYLDRHGEVLAVPRKEASAATGVQRFTGVAATPIPVNTEVAVPTVNDDEPVTYLTTAEAVIEAGGTVDVPIEAAEVGSEGNAVPGAVSLLLSAVPGVTGVTNPESITGGADVETDESFVLRLLQVFTGVRGAGTGDDYERWVTEEAGVGGATVSAEDPAPGFVRVVVTDSLNDPVSAALLTALQAKIDPITASGTLDTAVTFPATTLTLLGTNPTATFLNEGYALVSGTSVVKYTGKTATTLTGVTGGSGTHGVGSTVVQSGRAGGKAPAGARVLLQTPAARVVESTATLALEDGYSLDGTGGTVAVRALVTAAVQGYINSLKPGEDVILEKVKSLMFSARGVKDISNVQIRVAGGSFASSNITMSVLQVAQAGTVTLAETLYVNA